MVQPEFGITQFVRGMAWHDVGKPFALGTGRHVWLGYWLLVRAGFPAEALVALTHGGGKWSKGLKEVLNPYFDQDGNALPAIILLANPLDQISASVYSLLARAIDLDTFKGKKDSTEEERNPLFHAWQNPFSRLPMAHRNFREIGDPQGDHFIIRESVESTRVPHSRAEQLDERLWGQMIATLPDEWKDLVSQVSQDEVTSEKALETTPATADGQALLRALEPFQRRYPERTYPPANDTTLGEHTRLSGALAFVLYRNLERKTPQWLRGQISRRNGETLLDVPGELKQVHQSLAVEQGGGPEGHDVNEAWNRARRSACAHLEARLVRVAFEGHRTLFEDAVRVDDLLGARTLTQRFLDTFEHSLARVLDVPGLLWGSADGERRCLLTINRSQFDLFYFLPPYPDPDREMSVEEVLDLTYEDTLDRVVDELITDLRQDFRRAVRAGKLSFGPEEDQALRRQLWTLGYGLRVLKVETPEPDQFPSTFAAFTSTYGNSLVERFRDSLKFALVPPGDDRPRIQPVGETDKEALPPEETCDVCGNHPIFQPFAVLLEDDEWCPYVQKVIHHFRGEPERPCLSCIARRILAHGVVAEETAALQHMVDWADKESDTPRRLIAVKPEGGPSLPPALAAHAEFTDDDDFVDLGAAYARYRRDGDHVSYDVPPQLFPTVGYAADATGNVVLLALQPTMALYDTYQYAHALTKSSNLPGEVKRGDRHPETDGERWQASFVLLHRWVRENQTEGLADNMANIQPHLARVMERIRHSRTFYRVLKEALEEEPLRVLPLDVDFPTLRLLVPADELDKVLRVLDQVMTETLFSATYFKELEKRRRSHELLQLLVPDLLHGAVILFKQKFPLYLALEAERALFHHLAATDDRKKTSDRPSHSDWYGLRMAFTDLRGTLSQVGPVRAEVTYANLSEVLNLADPDPRKGVDRRTVLLRAEAQERASRELGKPTTSDKAADALREFVDALTVVRADRVQLSQDKVKQLIAEDNFSPVLFLKRAIRG